MTKAQEEIKKNPAESHEGRQVRAVSAGAVKLTESVPFVCHCAPDS